MIVKQSFLMNKSHKNIKQAEFTNPGRCYAIKISADLFTQNVHPMSYQVVRNFLLEMSRLAACVIKFCHHNYRDVHSHRMCTVPVLAVYRNYSPDKKLEQMQLCWDAWKNEFSFPYCCAVCVQLSDAALWVFTHLPPQFNIKSCYLFYFIDCMKSGSKF